MKKLAAVIALACATCATPPSDPTLLFSRAYAPPNVACGAERCWWGQPEWTFRDGRGHDVVMSPSRRTTRFEVAVAPDVGCGETSYARGTYRWLHHFVDDTEQSSTLRFEDGSAADLSPKEAIAVQDRCWEETGDWEGVDGSYEGRRGVYRLVWDGLQAELTLTDASRRDDESVGSTGAPDQASKSTSIVSVVGRDWHVRT